MVSYLSIVYLPAYGQLPIFVYLPAYGPLI